MIQAIVFSNNSPEFLNVFLQSAKEHSSELFEFYVLYKADATSDSKYKSIFEKYSINLSKKESNFKEDLLFLMNQPGEGLISFFKDTNYFYSKVPDTDINKIMSDEDIFCFSMGLGKNIKHCYHNDVYNVLLNEEENGDNTIKWNWVKHYLDFGRPLELGAGHTFHKKEILKLFKKWSYTDIIGLESSFDNLDYYPKESMSSFKNSVLVDIVYKEDIKKEALNSFDFNNLDRIIIEI